MLVVVDRDERHGLGEHLRELDVRKAPGRAHFAREARIEEALLVLAVAGGAVQRDGRVVLQLAAERGRQACDLYEHNTESGCLLFP